MSDAISDSLKPSFWEEFFDIYKSEIKNDVELNWMINKYSLKGSAEMKLDIMTKLSKYNRFECYNEMFKDSWRFPSDVTLLNIINS